MCSMLDVHAARSASLCCGPSGSSRNRSVVNEVGGMKIGGTKSSGAGVSTMSPPSVTITRAGIPRQAAAPSSVRPMPGPSAEDAQLVGGGHSRCPVAHAELLEDMGEMGLHRRLADEQLPRDRPVGSSPGHEHQHLLLPDAQVRPADRVVHM